ncbi:MAG: LacI family DNA-binding transcriptional regulator [Bacteroidota bacterium]
MPTPKLKDIADALGLSYSTVSRALKGNFRISEETRHKVNEYAAKIKYIPNIAAQSLRNNRTRSIGILVPNISNNFFSEVLNGIESAGYDKNYQVIITQSQESGEKESKNIDTLMSRAVDGLLVSLSSTTLNAEKLKAIHESGTPVVFFDRVCSLFDTYKVVSDNEGGSYKVVKHLIRNGYTRIAHITSSPEKSITSERLSGYQKGLEESNIPFDASLVKYCVHGGMLPHEVEKSIDELLELDPWPGAIITASDRITIVTMASLYKRKIAIPEQIAVAGFSNFSVPEIFAPPLTTVKQPAFEMGKIAADLLIKLIESKKPVANYEKIVLPTELTVRASTALKMAPVG